MSYKMGEFDVAVVGGGHAGVEAALASARLGCKTVMFTISLETLFEKENSDSANAKPDAKAKTAHAAANFDLIILYSCVSGPVRTRGV